MACPLEQPQQSYLPETDLKNLLPDPRDRLLLTGNPTCAFRNHWEKLRAWFAEQVNPSPNATSPRSVTPPTACSPSTAFGNFPFRVCIMRRPPQIPIKTPVYHNREIALSPYLAAPNQYGTRSDLPAQA